LQWERGGRIVHNISVYVPTPYRGRKVRAVK
jgi:hypothetical protein